MRHWLICFQRHRMIQDVWYNNTGLPEVYRPSCVTIASLRKWTVLFATLLLFATPTCSNSSRFENICHWSHRINRYSISTVNRSQYRRGWGWRRKRRCECTSRWLLVNHKQMILILLSNPELALRHPETSTTRVSRFFSIVSKTSLYREGSCRDILKIPNNDVFLTSIHDGRTKLTH